MEYLVNLREWMQHAKALLTDADKTAFFFVALPEALPIAVINRFIQWFSGRQGQFGLAQSLYGLALRLWPDTAARRIALLNRGALWVKAGNPQRAREVLEPLLQEEDLSPRHAAAAHYNLGIAYERLGQGDRAVGHFNAAIEALPGSLYALGAEAALRRRRKAAAPPAEPQAPKEGNEDEG